MKLSGEYFQAVIYGMRGAGRIIIIIIVAVDNK